MNSDKFYSFVRTIAKNDPALVESIIGAHQLIYGEPLQEGLGKALATGALALGLAGGGTKAHAGFFGSDKAKTEMSEQSPESVKQNTTKLLKLVANDFIETNSFMDSPNIEKLADYINSLPENLKTVALAECSRFRNQFKLGTPDDNIVSGLGQFNVAMR